MKKNTALQELIEYCNKCEKASSDKMMQLAMRGISKKATELLSKEREDIEGSYEDGKSDGINRYVQTLAKDGTDYFNNTFNQLP